VDHRLFKEHRLEIGGRERLGVDSSQALPQREWAKKRLHHRHPLVELEPHDQSHRVRGDQRIRFVRLGEIQAVGHAPDRNRDRHAADYRRSAARAAQ
jgi:hypothetical protein